jgi:hypothetical protein
VAIPLLPDLSPLWIAAPFRMAFPSQPPEYNWLFKVVSNSNYIAACVFVAAGTCLLIHCLEKCCITPFFVRLSCGRCIATAVHNTISINLQGVTSQKREIATFEDILKKDIQDRDDRDSSWSETRERSWIWVSLNSVICQKSLLFKKIQIKGFSWCWCFHHGAEFFLKNCFHVR